MEKCIKKCCLGCSWECGHVPISIQLEPLSIVISDNQITKNQRILFFFILNLFLSLSLSSRVFLQIHNFVIKAYKRITSTIIYWFIRSCFLFPWHSMWFWNKETNCSYSNRREFVQSIIVLLLQSSVSVVYYSDI